MSKLTALGTLLALTACHHHASTHPVVGNVPATPVAPTIVMTDKMIASLDGDTPATQEALSKKLVGFEIKKMTPKDPPPFAGGNSSDHFEAWKDNQRQFAIIISGETIFNVHTENPTVSVEGHPNWHVGATFAESKALTRCDCWGDNVVCWKDGEHAALAFDRACPGVQGNDMRALAVLDGLPIKRMVWNPKPFVGDEDSTTPTPEHGGGLSGTVHIHDHQPSGGGDPCGGGDDGDDDGDE